MDTAKVSRLDKIPKTKQASYELQVYIQTITQLYK